MHTAAHTEAMHTVLRPLTPSITEPLDELHTARPTAESKSKTSKVVAKRLALAVANLQNGPVVRPDDCR